MFGTDGSTELGRKRNFHNCCENTRTYGDPSGMVELLDWNAAVAKIPLLASDPSHGDGKEGFRGIYNSNAGWVDPIAAMTILRIECEHLGVTFTSGPSGTAVELLRATNGKTICGVRTEDGGEVFADRIILATGSYSNTLLDFHGQIEAVGVSHH